MCGFLWKLDSKQGWLDLRSDLERAGREFSRSRGPDGSASVEVVSGAQFLGGCHFSRLAIDDLSPASMQPIDTGRFFATINGEIYNSSSFVNDKAEKLKSDCWQFCCSQELMVSPLDAIRKIDGMASGVILDRKEGVVYLFRDRFGQKPLFYKDYVGGDGQGCLDICSDRRLLSANSPLDRQEIEEVLAYGFSTSTTHMCDPECEDYVFSVPPGSVRIYQYVQNSLEFRKEIAALSLPEWIKVVKATRKADFAPTFEFESALMAAVEDLIPRDVEFGVTLSGGVDSACAALACRELGHKPLAYAVVERSDDQRKKLVDTLATNMKLDLKIVEYDFSRIAEEFDSVVKAYDFPFGDSSAVLAYFLGNAVSDDGARVLIGGDGADELFFGYRRAQMFGRIVQQLRYPILQESVGYSLWEFLYRFAMRKYTPISSFAKVRSPIYPKRSNLGLPVYIMESEIANYLSADIFQKIDRALMAHSVEARSPFVSSPLVEYALNNASQFGVSIITGRKDPLREYLSGLGCLEFIENKKTGFSWNVDFIAKAMLIRKFSDYDTRVSALKWNSGVSLKSSRDLLNCDGEIVFRHIFCLRWCEIFL